MGMAARGVTAMEAVDTRDLLIPTQLLHLVQQLTTVQLYMRFILRATLTPAPYTMLYTMLAQFTMPCPPVVLYMRVVTFLQQLFIAILCMMETAMATLIPAMVIPLLLAMAILPHHMDTLMDTILPSTALLFINMNLLMAQLPMDKIHRAMDIPHLLLKDTVLATVTPATDMYCIYFNENICNSFVCL